MSDKTVVPAISGSETTAYTAVVALKDAGHACPEETQEQSTGEHPP